MADRSTPTPRGSGDSGERRQVPSRSGGYSERPQSSRGGSGYDERPQSSRASSGYGERPQTSRGGSGYGERPQSSRGGSGYGERPQTSRGGSGYSERPQSSRSSGERRAAPSRGGSSSRQSSPRRADVIRCENCGEDYSITYKRCPFCDERPGRGGISGKRVANTRGGGYGRPVNPIQIAGLVISLALIASALFIVFRFVGAPIFGNKGKNPGPGSNSSVSTSQGNQSNGSANQPGPVAPPMLQSISLNSIDAPLDSGATFQLIANLLPAGAVGEVSWSSSNPAAATVDATGLVTNVNLANSDVQVTITATCGDVTAETSVTCKARTIGGGAVTPGTKGRIINAEKGLNIRSGPSKDSEKVASAQNGSTVTILGEENGFYKINYTGDKIGYVSKDYVSVG